MVAVVAKTVLLAGLVRLTAGAKLGLNARM
jgi:hypothetical protein